MRGLHIAACFALACAYSSGAAPLARAQAASSSSASASPKPASHKRTANKHRARVQPKQKAPTPDRISEIQSALARGGYYQGDPNGKWDSTTVAALQKFQSANGIGANGKLDAPTLQKLGLGSDIAGVSAPKTMMPGCCSMQPSGSGSPPAAGAPAPSCCSVTQAPRPQSTQH